jgi:hypothetical protein
MCARQPFFTALCPIISGLDRIGISGVQNIGAIPLRDEFAAGGPATS